MKTNKGVSKKVLMIWTQNNTANLGGVGYYRIVSPARKLKEFGYDIDVVAGNDIDKHFGTGKHENKLIDVYSDMLSKYDLIWMKHTDSDTAVTALFSMKERFGCKIVWDFDDDLFSVKPSQPIAWEEYKPGTRKRAVVAAAVSMCDALTVSTVPLKESLSKMLKEVFGIEKEIYVCPNFVNTEEWNKVKYYPSNSPTIGYFGSTTHNEDLEMVLPQINKVLLKYPTARFQVMGALSNEDTIKLFSVMDRSVLDRCSTAGGTVGWDGFPSLLLKMKWDISIAPLVDDKFNNCKSHIKWLESSMKGIPTVASNVYPYKEEILGTKTIENNKTGLLVSNSDWTKALSKLIESPDLRVKIGSVARETVIKNWSADKQIKHWKQTLDKLLK